MRLVPAILLFVAVLITFDYVVNDGDVVRDVVDWSIDAGRDVAGVIHRLVMTFFGE